MAVPFVRRHTLPIGKNAIEMLAVLLLGPLWRQSTPHSGVCCWGVYSYIVAVLQLKVANKNIPGFCPPFVFLISFELFRSLSLY